jgi:hypothetical protein
MLASRRTRDQHSGDVTRAPLAQAIPGSDPRGTAPGRFPSPHVHRHLLGVVRTIIRADSDPARQTLFAHVVRSRPLVRFIYRLHRSLAGTTASALLVSCYGLAAFLRIARGDNRTARVLVVAGHENARQEVSRVVAWMGAADCEWVRTDAGAALGGLRLLHPFRTGTRRRLVKVLRLIGTIDDRHGFLVSCRAAAGIAWYARAKAILDAQRPGAILVSSDSNPEEAGFVGAARALGVPQVFISHAYPTPFSPPLDFTLSILEGESAVRTRLHKGPITGRILLAGIAGDSAPLDAGRFERTRPVIGIFPPKAFSWHTLAAIIDDCRTHFQASRIVIRWHPSMIEPARLARVVADRAGIEESPRTASLPEVAGQCDWVVAGENSNVHLPVLKLGIPTVVVKGLGLYPGNRSDLYDFVANRIVFPPVTTIRDVQPDALRAFFADTWSARFVGYDAAYLRPHAEIGEEVRRAIVALVERPAPPAPG